MVIDYRLPPSEKRIAHEGRLLPEGHPGRDLADLFGVARSTVYRAIEHAGSGEVS